MQKGFLFLFFVFLFCSLGCGCRKNADSERQPVISPTDTRSEEKEIYYVEGKTDSYPVSQTITFVYSFFPGIPEKDQNEINRILYEKGYDCQIRFIKPVDEKGGPLLGTEYEEWVDAFEKTFGPIDIITSSSWRTYDTACDEFLKAHLLPLNECLETEEGQILKERYTADEWNSVTLNGKTYVIPRAVFGGTPDYGIDAGIYISVSEKYADYFSGFDGTYASLRTIYDTIGDNNLYIVTNLINEQTLCGLLGYSYFDITHLPYKQENENVIDMTRMKDFSSLLNKVYEDLSSGLLIYSGHAESIPDGILAYIHEYETSLKEGWIHYLISPKMYEFNPRMSYGISVNSEQKNLAFRVFSFCFSDPEIICLLTGCENRELIANRVDSLLTIPRMRLSGIHFDFTEKQVGELRKCDESFSRLINKLFIQSDEEQSRLNPDFDAAKAWEEFVNEAGNMTEVCEAANQTIAAWLQK